jgi:hypothetical protein
METRGITFKELKENCTWDTKSNKRLYCCHAHYGYMGSHCLKKNCPVWRKLKVIK